MRDPISSGKPFANPKQRTFLAGAGLVVLTLILYWPVIGYEFIVVDDDRYVFENQHVAFGISWPGIKWAFTTLDVSNWHPLTWISHMLDCTVWGLFSGGHHLTNVLIHTANVLLLFLLLKQCTGAFWRSAFVAALFAWHPTHLESVAWICERKDVLSTLFFLLTIGAYWRYVRAPAAGRYLLALLLFAGGLMSKPMVVTLPCLLLVLDFWPLRRSERAEASASAFRLWAKLLGEKIPFFALAFISSLLTIKAQHGAMSTMQQVSLPLRLANALGSYALYLEKAFVPVHLSVFYPLPAKPPLVLAALAAVLLIAVTVLAFLWRRRSPALLTGWLWFLGTLVPVIGLIQVGTQSMADRYTYIPYIGLFIALAWSGEQLAAAWPRIRGISCGVAVAVLAAVFTWTRMQLPYWHDSIRLFTHALETTGSTAFTESNLSYALLQAGRTREAIPHYEAVLRFKPKDVRARANYARALVSVGRIKDAEVQLAEALKIQPTSERLHNNLGLLLAAQGKSDEALEHFSESIRLDPEYVYPYFNRGMVYQQKGMAGEAVTNYTKALELQPDGPDVLDKLALLRAACPEPKWRDPSAAVKLAERENALTRTNSAECLRTLAYAYAANGAYSNAVPAAEWALKTVRGPEAESKARELARELEDYRAGRLPPMNWTNISIAVFTAR